MGGEATQSGRRVRDTLRVAAYLEEAGEEPAKSCDTLLGFGIPYVVLRHIWTGNITGLTDSSYHKLREIILERDMTVIMVASDLGGEPADSLHKVSEEKIDHVFNLAQYFKAPFVRIGIGTKCNGECVSLIDDWMGKISTKAIAANVTPLLEVTNDSHISSPSGIANQFLKHKRWKLLYDPVQFILRQNQDPFVKYWTLLKNNVAAIDVRDLKIGKGFKAAGHGNSKIDLTIKDALGSGYQGWYIMEPSFGRRHGDALTKHDTFKLALDAFDAIIE